MSDNVPWWIWVICFAIGVGMYWGVAWILNVFTRRRKIDEAELREVVRDFTVITTNEHRRILGLTEAIVWNAPCGNWVNHDRHIWETLDNVPHRCPGKGVIPRVPVVETEEL